VEQLTTKPEELSAILILFIGYFDFSDANFVDTAGKQTIHTLWNGKKHYQR
jgi:hypothetical protein